MRYFGSSILGNLFCLSLNVFIIVIMQWSTDRCQAAADAPGTLEGNLIESERQTLRKDLEDLQVELLTLRQKLNLPEDHWADAQVYLKAVQWELDLEPQIDAPSLELVRSALTRARERIEQLRSGQVSWGQAKGRIARGFVSSVDGSTQPYGLIIPPSYDPQMPIRLDIVLHGSDGARAKGIGELKFLHRFDASEANDPSIPDQDFIEVHPMGRLGENAYRFEGETDVDEAVAAVCRNYSIDRNRIVLRGSSLGGVGTWQLGLKRPDRYAALGPSAGPVDTIEFANSPWPHFVRLEPITPWQQTMLHLVDAIDYTANAGMVPTVAAMGDQDPYYSSHLLMQRAFEREGVPFEELVDRGAGHSITARVFQQQLRQIGEHATKGINRSPPHVRFVTWTLKFSRCHWLEIMGLAAHYQRAEVDANLANDGSVEIQVPVNVTRIALYPPALRSPSTSLTIGGKTVALPPNRITNTMIPVVVESQDGEWVCCRESDDALKSRKRPGLQGPIDDAFATRFLCVRGTGTAWNPAVGAWSEANLRRFSDEWRRHYRGFLPIKDDCDVTDDDLATSNLILFGDPGSNPWIARLLPQLPAEWSQDKIGFNGHEYPSDHHALQLIYPSPWSGPRDRYVVLNSGHTYHDAELRFSYMVFPRHPRKCPRPARNLGRE
ncbi:MAG: prolyl oligopeptidase family serine peptidase [Planctomycetota bacterium]|nr:prolyl oligopeptidase family serine peptidase [Planctomycetota bacterium]